MSSLDTPRINPTENVETSRPALITPRSVFLGVVTIVALHIYTNHAGLVMGSSALVKSQYPMAMLIPFFLWLFVNIVLKAFFPSAALSGRELLVIYCMSWISSGIALEGWAAYWSTIVSTPTYYASPENQWQEVLFRCYSLVGVYRYGYRRHSTFLRRSFSGYGDTLDRVDQTHVLVGDRIHCPVYRGSLPLHALPAAMGGRRATDISSRAVRCPPDFGVRRDATACLPSSKKRSSGRDSSLCSASFYTISRAISSTNYRLWASMAASEANR